MTTVGEYARVEEPLFHIELELPKVVDLNSIDQGIRTFPSNVGLAFKDVAFTRGGNAQGRRVTTINRQDLFGEWPSWAHPAVAVYTPLPGEAE